MRDQMTFDREAELPAIPRIGSGDWLGGGMTNERWMAIINDDSLELTAEEIRAGWHFCFEWDGLLIGPGMEEMKACICEPPPNIRS